jgi:hypothetical protein
LDKIRAQEEVWTRGEEGLNRERRVEEYSPFSFSYLLWDRKLKRKMNIIRVVQTVEVVEVV